MGMNASRAQIPYSGGGGILKFRNDRYTALHNIFFLFTEFLMNLTPARLRGNLPRSQYTCLVYSSEILLIFLNLLCSTRIRIIHRLGYIKF